MDDTSQHKTDHGKIATMIVNGLFVVPAIGILLWAVGYFLRRLGWLKDGLDEVSKSVLVLGAALGAASFLYLMLRLSGASPDSSTHRKWYLGFRRRAGARGLGSIYGMGVNRALARLDQFVRDAGRADESLRPRAFGLHDPAPLWTVQSFNACLILAAAYPLLVVVLGWLWAGHAGPLERGLVMRSVGLEQRIGVGGLALAAMIAAALSEMWSGWREKLALAIAIIFGSIGAILGGGFGILSVLLLAVWVADSGSDAEKQAPYIGLAVSVLLGGLTIALGFSLVTNHAFGQAGAFLTFALVAAGCYAVFTLFERGVPKLPHGSRAALHVAVTLALLALCLAAPTIVAGNGQSRTWAPLYFVGLLTLINAPIDWIALGLTRALLRRGQERGGLWPLWYGLADIALSLVLMGLLAVLTLGVTIVFNAALARGGWGHSFVDLHATFAALRDPAKRLQPEFWWLYAMLFSTQIPALANLTFGCWCGLRGWTWLNRRLAQALPLDGSMELWVRVSVAFAWSLQQALAFIAGCLGFYWLVWRGAMWALDALFGAALAGGLGMLAT